MNTLEIAKAKRNRLAAEIKKIDDFIAMAEDLEREASPNATLPLLSISIEPKNQHKRLSIAKQVMGKVVAFLELRGTASTAAITEYVLSEGIDPSPSSENKKNAVSVLLSKAQQQVYNDKSIKQWRLVEPESSGSHWDAPTVNVKSAGVSLN